MRPTLQRRHFCRQLCRRTLGRDKALPAVSHRGKVTLDAPEGILCWAVVAISTVRHGDATPVTAAGRIFPFGLMAVGIGAFAIIISSLGLVIGKLREPKNQRHG